MKKILIIDDEKDFCIVTKKNLERKGDYLVDIANDGPTGVSMAAAVKPDLILLDIIMPGVGGFDVLRELKSGKETSSIPVIIVTAIGSDEAREKSKVLDDDDYVIKPVLIADLEKSIRRVLSKKSR